MASFTFDRDALSTLCDSLDAKNAKNRGSHRFSLAAEIPEFERVEIVGRDVTSGSCFKLSKPSLFLAPSRRPFASSIP